MEIGYYKNLPMHRKVRYLIDDRDIANVMLGHWSGDDGEFDMERVDRFLSDVETCGLTLEQFMQISWGDVH